jgi:hypothetical protein
MTKYEQVMLKPMLHLAKVSAGALLAFSLAMIGAVIVQLNNPENIGKDRENSLYTLIFFSATSGFSAWVFRGALSIENKKRQAILLAGFYELIKENKGRLTLLSFAAKTGLSGKDARIFLDERAREFNGDFEADINGNVIYVFYFLDYL